eukprot:213790-Amphidinium_carterae.1
MPDRDRRNDVADESFEKGQYDVATQTWERVEWGEAEQVTREEENRIFIDQMIEWASDSRGSVLGDVILPHEDTCCSGSATHINREGEVEGEGWRQDPREVVQADNQVERQERPVGIKAEQSRGYQSNSMHPTRSEDGQQGSSMIDTKEEEGEVESMRRKRQPSMRRDQDCGVEAQRASKKLKQENQLAIEEWPRQIGKGRGLSGYKTHGKGPGFWGGMAGHDVDEGHSEGKRKGRGYAKGQRQTVEDTQRSSPTRKAVFTGKNPSEGPSGEVGDSYSFLTANGWRLRFWVPETNRRGQGLVGRH